MSKHDAPSMSPRLALAVEIALEAGEHTLSYFRQAELQVDRKADKSPVTVADREAELLLRERIAAAFPGDAILGEEFPERAGTSGYRWILDPIDGTKSFIHGVPLYGTLVGIEHDGRSLAGVINIPACDEMVFAEKGGGAWHRIGEEGVRHARVSSRSVLAEGLFVTSEVPNFAARGRASAYSRLEQASGLSRTWGDCFGYLLVATGRALVMVDPIMNVWDAAAVQPIIEEAGGRFTDWNGEVTIHHGEGIATNGLVHDEVLGLLKETAEEEKRR
jgi:histidinol phosphatase-like enzyme (inositol monophosphatase family)